MDSRRILRVHLILPLLLTLLISPALLVPLIFLLFLLFHLFLPDIPLRLLLRCLASVEIDSPVFPALFLLCLPLHLLFLQVLLLIPLILLSLLFLFLLFSLQTEFNRDTPDFHPSRFHTSHQRSKTRFH